MKPFTSKILIINVLLLFIVSCTHERIELAEKTPEQEIIREIALIVGTVLQNPAVTNEVLTAMTIVDEYNELVSITFLMGSRNNLKKNEIAAVSSFSNKNAGNTVFKNAVVNEFSSRKNNYPALSRAIKERFPESVRLKSSAFHEFDYLAELLEDDGYQIFFPYSQNRDIQEPLESYYVSYDPLNGSDHNEAFLFESGKQDYIIIDVIDNDFADLNPVFGIIPIDPCDIPGEPCEFIELFPYQSSANLPPVFENEATLLTYNVNHNHMTDDKDMITTRIPKIRILGTSYMGFLGTHQKLTLQRGAGEGNITFSNGQIVASGVPHTIGYIRTHRNNIKGKNPKWLAFSGNFDSDWRMSKHSQAMAVFSNHNLKGTAKITAGYKSGFKIGSDGKIEAYSEWSGNGEVTLTEGGAKFRALNEISRRQALATIVGNHSTYTHEDGGVHFNVKQVGIVEFYFKHWHTSFAD